MCLLIIWYKQTTYKRGSGNFGKNFNIINNDTTVFSNCAKSNEVCVKRDEKEKKTTPLGVESSSLPWTWR